MSPSTAPTAPTIYPIADRRQDWFGVQFPGSVMDRVDKILLHTTEGGSWPDYRDGATTPNLTYHPGKRRWRQHLPLNRSARALVDDPSTAVRENRDNVVQVEIICSCDPDYAAKHRLLRAHQLSDESLRDLGEFLAFMARGYRVPLVAAPKWLPYPKSAGNSPVRMNGKCFDAFRGVLGHMHASGNRHGDPGDLNVQRIIWHANRALRPIGPVPALTIPTTRKVGTMARPGYFLGKTPDGRYWGITGLQCTHLETNDVIKAYCDWTGLTKADAGDITYDALENFQRIT